MHRFRHEINPNQPDFSPCQKPHQTRKLTFSLFFFRKPHTASQRPVQSVFSRCPIICKLPHQISGPSDRAWLPSLSLAEGDMLDLSCHVPAIGLSDQKRKGGVRRAECITKFQKPSKSGSRSSSI